MTTAAYYIDQDGHGEPTLWTATRAAHSSRAIARRCDTPAELWALARVLADPSRFGDVMAADSPDSVRSVLEHAVASELNERAGVV